MFVFLHIPKAAGTTFREIISAEINPRKRLSLDDISRIAYAPDEWLNSHDFISGHFGVSLLSRLHSGCQVITMLRNPVARTISQYKYFKELSERDTDFNTYAALLRDRSLKEILSDPDDVVINSLFRNTQTWALVSDYQHHFRNHLMSDDEALAIAKESLEKMDFFGLVEAMEDSLAGLNALFGWNIRIKEAASVKSNPTGWQEDCEGLRDVILENNQLDLALYNWAEIKFRERLSMLSINRAAHQPAIAELADWKSLQFPEYKSEDFSFANGALGVQLLNDRVQRAESAMAAQSRLNAELRIWAESAEARIAKEQDNTRLMRTWAERTEQFLLQERQTSSQLRDWAERTEALLRAERDVSLQLREVLNNRR